MQIYQFIKYLKAIYLDLQFIFVYIVFKIYLLINIIIN